jgi:subfamily B ATP-binding cassette protein MsbA
MNGMKTESSSPTQSFFTSTLIKRLIQNYARPYFGHLILAAVTMIIVALASVAPAKLIEPIINDIFVAKKATMLLPVTLMVVGVFLVKGIATYIESVLTGHVGQRIIADLQKDLFNHLILDDLEFFQNTTSGNLVSHFTNDVNKLNTAVTGTLTNLCKDGLTLIFFILLMFYQDWLLASIALFVLPIAIFPVIRIGKRMRKVSGNVQEEMAGFTSLLSQAFQGMRLIKSYGLEKIEANRVSHHVEQIFSRTLKATRMKSASHPLMEFLGGVAIGIVILYGGNEVIQGTQNPGAFFSFITALIMTYEPLKRLANLNANLQEQLASAERVFKLMDRRPGIVDIESAQDIKINKGKIDFENIDFAYKKRSDVLNNITLSIQAGKTTALVGPSGGGKSTLLNLIPRFYNVTRGQVKIDEQDVSKVTLKSLRSCIALVSQEIILFDDSVKANIAFGRPGASDEQIIDAAKAAAAHDFIMALPQGYDTQIGENGTSLSGGQRQRLSIARAMIKDAPILLLDEPTSALDTASEQKVQEALRTLMKGRTTLIIAHRLSTVKDADQIILIDQGIIKAIGTHSELLKTSKQYALLSQSQLSEKEVA